MDELIEKFGTIYTDLYNGTFKGKTTGLVNKFDTLLHSNPDFKNLVCEFCKARQDFISSDREALAFMIAISDKYTF